VPVDTHDASFAPRRGDGPTPGRARIPIGPTVLERYARIVRDTVRIDEPRRIHAEPRGSTGVQEFEYVADDPKARDGPHVDQIAELFPQRLPLEGEKILDASRRAPHENVTRLGSAPLEYGYLVDVRSRTALRVEQRERNRHTGRTITEPRARGRVPRKLDVGLSRRCGRRNDRVVPVFEALPHGIEERLATAFAPALERRNRL
jgi:hypothetical protein